MEIGGNILPALPDGRTFKDPILTDITNKITNEIFFGGGSFCFSQNKHKL